MIADESTETRPAQPERPGHIGALHQGSQRTQPCACEHPTCHNFRGRVSARGALGPPPQRVGLPHSKQSAPHQQAPAPPPKRALPGTARLVPRRPRLRQRVVAGRAKVQVDRGLAPARRPQRQLGPAAAAARGGQRAGGQAQADLSLRGRVPARGRLAQQPPRQQRVGRRALACARRALSGGARVAGARPCARVSGRAPDRLRAHARRPASTCGRALPQGQARPARFGLRPIGGMGWVKTCFIGSEANMAACASPWSAQRTNSIRAAQSTPG